MRRLAIAAQDWHPAHREGKLPLRHSRGSVAIPCLNTICLIRGVLLPCGTPESRQPHCGLIQNVSTVMLPSMASAFNFCSARSRPWAPPSCNSSLKIFCSFGRGGRSRIAMSCSAAPIAAS